MIPDNQLIRKFFEVFNDRNLEEMGRLLNPDATLYFPKTQPIAGKARILKFIAILLKKFPELAFTVQRVIRQGDQAAVHWTNRGVNRRKEPYQNEGVTIFELQEGKISYISDFFKDTEKF